MRHIMIAVVAFLFAIVSTAHAWYIPGVSPVSYVKDQPVNIRVNSLTSHQGILPYPFYSIKTCTPPKDRLKEERKVENIGEILWGDQIEPSLFRAEMRHNAKCRRLCDPLQYTAKELSDLEKKINLHYRGNLVLDNLPVAQKLNAGPSHPKMLIGYPLGVPKKLSPTKANTIIYNHLDIEIGYNVPDEAHHTNDAARIVAFRVKPRSIKYSRTEDCNDEKQSPPEYPALSVEDVGPATPVMWTYSVEWVEEPENRWATRWDTYLSGGENDDRIHWYSIFNSLIVVLFLSGMVAMILMRALHKDFNRYNDIDNPDEAKEESGWKMVHGDVFRTPNRPTLLAVVIGTGSQIAGMSLITLVFACLGFLSPSNRGGLLTAVILLFVLLGSYAGYVSARLLKYFKRQSWKNIFFAGIFFPSVVAGIYLTLNTVQWASSASSAIPFSTLLLLLALWLCISLPLVFAGGVIGYRREVLQVPTKVNAIPRLIPKQKWYLEDAVVIMASGVLPFGAAFIELLFILSSFWQGRVYYVFGFLGLVFVIMLITCAEISIVMVYFQLCYENYHWWWRSFLLTASSGLYLFLYSVYYFCVALTVRQWSSTLLYFGYMLMGSIVFSVFTGTIGFLAAFTFVRKIYGAIKIE